MFWDHHSKKSQQVTAGVQASVLNCFSSQHEEPPVEGSLASAPVAHLHYPHLTWKKAEKTVFSVSLYIRLVCSNTFHAQDMLCHYLKTRT